MSRVKGRLPAIAVYDGAIRDQRRQGYSLRDIGENTGVSGERIRQILNSYYPDDVKPPELWTENKVAEYLKVSPYKLAALRKKGLLKPRRVSSRWIYSRGDIKDAGQLIRVRCAHCNRVIEGDRLSKYCRACSTEQRRYSYPFRSAEGKRRAEEANMRWMAKNPERYKVIQDKAQQRYYIKKVIREKLRAIMRLFVDGGRQEE